MSSLIANPIFKNLLRGLLIWAPLWIGTTFLFGLLGAGYVILFKTNTFLASQAILVRDEANGAVMRLGRFQSQPELKAAQETILEMAKSHQVVRGALQKIGPEDRPSWLPISALVPKKADTSSYPSSGLVDEIATRSISVHAPKGTEFGTTEVIYIDVNSDSQSRALALNQAICDALESRLQQVRGARADSVIGELLHARESAKRELAAATEKLHRMESESGADLSDLRGLTDMVAGGSSSRIEFDQIKNEIRQTEQILNQLESDHELLLKAIEDPESLVVAPSGLLNSQPGLKRFREGLVDAQLNGSQLVGRFTEDHPLVIASRTAQGTIANRFSNELKASLLSVEADIKVARQKMERLETQKKGLELRLAKLADQRAAYANLSADVKSRTVILDAAEKELAEATATRDSSPSVSLLTRLDAPIVNDRPLGPGNSTLVAVSAIAGLAFGVGIVFLITPLDSGTTYGRRLSDRLTGRRQSDLTESTGQGNRAVRPQPPTASDVDLAFEHLMRLSRQAPENRSEESAVQMKIQELKYFLSSRGFDPEIMKTDWPTDPLPATKRVKPRPASTDA
ncbi:MAG: hypothetical protein FJ308_07530 [Planctomycetes bacterium]|nr:hypothetical protein [Planctomycetota bacterium]